MYKSVFPVAAFTGHLLGGLRTYQAVRWAECDVNGCDEQVKILVVCLDIHNGSCIKWPEVSPAAPLLVDKKCSLSSSRTDLQSSQLVYSGRHAHLTNSEFHISERKRCLMAQTTVAIPLQNHRSADHPEASASGVTWSAVLAGAVVTAALYLILLTLGAGLGLSSVSAWSNTGATASKIGTASIIWFIFAEIISSSVGGYLAGRLRTKWTVIHGDEVYFRDTAHGFLSWSAALVVTAAILGAAATAAIGGGSPSSSSESSHSAGPNAYFVDTLLRSDSLKDVGNPAQAEVATILATSLHNGTLAGDDKAYLDRMVMAKTGLDQGAADKRVNDVFANAQEAAEAARKTAAHTLLWIFIALLIGAFCASFAGTIGGKQRDNVVLL